MGRIAKPKKRTRAELAAMTADERLEYKRAHQRYRKRMQRVRARNGPSPITTRKKRKLQEGARLYCWERLLPHIEKRADGHWIWTGPFKLVYTRLRPIARAGTMGVEHVDYIVCCLSHGPQPPKCFVTKLCDEIACVAPDHVAWSNLVVETAKRRARYDSQVFSQQR